MNLNVEISMNKKQS